MNAKSTSCNCLDFCWYCYNFENIICICYYNINMNCYEYQTYFMYLVKFVVVTCMKILCHDSQSLCSPSIDYVAEMHIESMICLSSWISFYMFQWISDVVYVRMLYKHS